ncbi:efflux RND transporter periplasmic adaptor subunit [Aquabacterium sp. A7-Y]|uniref:efflux RND transporter periplasmic adaptor subunit n=1 Tax=Aquabacterium sp. A7-Y TaxID=1349605 RepID=UPI00223CD57A|nr:HlyD family efflux transporter periplasmic adaptor subunit [Aquabacterium sp. A7-Y]MCW7541914.1 efflux RND transporter periplasmic adaptor subunit [Aquabacterium sp. A7-Y]
MSLLFGPPLGIPGRVAALALGLCAVVFSPAHAGPGAHGPNGEHLDAPATVNASGLARLPDGSVNVPKLAQRRMGIRTLLAPLGEAAASVELNGRVLIDPNAGGRVQAVHGGRIEPGPNGLPVAGQAVRKGQLLAYVHHHAEPYAAANQQAELAQLRAARQLAEQRLQRLESLEGTVPRKDIEAARAELGSLRERERAIGGSLRSREGLVAPVSGVIAKADVLAGQVVEARDVLFEIIDPNRLLIEATTADASLPGRLERGTLSGMADSELRLVGASRSLREGVLPLTFRLQTAAGRTPPALAVGQPVTVVARLKERLKGIVLPAQSVVRNAANEPVVWIKDTAERFLAQPVVTRPLDAETVIVTQGLAADNRVVVQGAALINQIR